MILGMGNDVVEIERVGAAIGRNRDRFLKKILSDREYQQADGYSGSRLAEFTAGRFAAKEALAKALGCGIGKMGMANVTILVGEQGLTVEWEPSVGLNRVKKGDVLHVSISHSLHVAFAVAIWERR
ncbi:holo-ACP synthase [Alicyclobacillus dauci]|uniref:Holo-[acyl-carrier-protein] synthase n=1 Tax=Alicyclobacillus dauci TaxID=1475485 RepID=A0ABY6Z1S6_9BACL|nr:holo-ACP synthase [Alicyclobacillus dauci]WAH36684.1 holo-ACP synthase [Alicyclobacillus dauci]